MGKCVRRMTRQAESQADALPADSGGGLGSAHPARAEEGIDMAFDRPDPCARDGVWSDGPCRPRRSSTNVHPPPPPPIFCPLRPAGRDYLPEDLAPGLLIIPWAVRAQSGPSDLTCPIIDGLIALKWDVSARNAVSIPGGARVSETLTTRIPEFAHTHALRHATLTCLCVPDDGAADAGIPDATGTTCSNSDEDEDASSMRGSPPRPPRPPGDPCRRSGCVSLGAAPSAAGPAGGSRAPGPQRYLAATRNWRPGAGPATRGAIAPGPIQEGEGKLPENAQRLPLFRRAALMQLRVRHSQVHNLSFRAG